MWLVNNMSLGTEKAITGEKSLQALTTPVLRCQVFGWVIKWLVPVSEGKKKAEVRWQMIKHAGGIGIGISISGGGALLV